MLCVVKLVVIFGDGIGFEVIVEVEKVFDVVIVDSDVMFDKICFLFGVGWFFEIGDMFMDDDFVVIFVYDVILFGVVGGILGDLWLKDVNIECGLLFKFCFMFDYYVNLCLLKFFVGVFGLLLNLGEVDCVVVCEGMEGFYVGNGGVIWKGML